MPKTEFEELLEKIEESADDAKVIQKTISTKRKNRSDVPLRFDVEEDDHSFIANLTRYINSKNYVYQDLFDFCVGKATPDKGEEIWKRKAYNIIDSLKDQRSIRSDSIDLLAEFLNVDVILEEKKY